MTLTLNLTPAQEARLRAEAIAAGLTPEEYAARNLIGTVSVAAHSTDHTADLFAQWEVEDGTGDPHEIIRRKAEWEELKGNLNANRSVNGEEPLF